MTRRVLGEMRLGRASDEDVREEEERQAQLAALDAIAMPDIESALPAPMGHEGEARDAIAQTAPPEDPEASSATAHTLDGDWSDATTEPGARTPPRRAAPSDPELDALDAMARTPRVEATVRPDDSMAPDDDSPDSLHAMQPRRELAPDDAEPLGDQGLGRMVAPDGRDETPDERWSRLQLGGSFRDRPMPSEPMATDDDPTLPGEFRSPARSLGTPTTPPADERVDYVTDAESEDFPPTPGVMASDEPEFTYDSADPEIDAFDAMTGATPKPAPTEPEPRLDDGLPSDADIGGARERDGFLGFLRSLQNGLLGAIGRPRREMPHEAADLQERRDESMQQRMQAKGVQRREEAAAARADAAAEQEASRAEAQAEQGERRLQLQERGLDIQQRTADALTSQREAQTQHVATLDEIARASREEREDPASPISQGAQNAVRASLAALPEAMRVRLTDSIGDVSTMSAAQLEGVVRRLQTIGVRGTGGGGSGAPRGTSESLVQQLVDRGIVETTEEGTALLATIGARGARTAIQQSLSPTARLHDQTAAEGSGEEILPGVHAGIELQRGEGARMRAGFDTLSGNYASLGEMRRIAQEHGRTGVWSPQARADAAGARTSLMGMVAALENSGVVNEGAIPRIEEAIPDPSTASQAVLDTLETRVRAFERAIDQAVTARLRNRGVPADQIAEALRIIHGGDAGPRRARTAAPTGDSVRVRLPSGRVVVGPRSAVSRLPEGSEVLDGP